MKSNFTRFVVVLGLLVGGPLVSAQSEAGPQVSLKIDFVAWGDRLSDLTIRTGSRQEPIVALAYTYSKPVNYSGSNVLEIYRGGAAPPPAGPAGEANGVPPALAALQKQKPGLVGLATLPPNSRRATVLIAPGPAGTFQTYVIDDDPTKLPFGRLRIHNYSSETVAFRCNGKQNDPMKPGQAAVVSPVDNIVTYDLGYLKDEKWKIQESNALMVAETEQVQMVVLKSSNQHFVGVGGTKSGYLQLVVLRRPQGEVTGEIAPPPPPPKDGPPGGGD